MHAYLTVCVIHIRRVSDAVSYASDSVSYASDPVSGTLAQRITTTRSTVVNLVGFCNDFRTLRPPRGGVIRIRRRVIHI